MGRRATRVRATWPRCEPDAIVVVIDGPVERDGVAALCRRVGALVESCDARVVVCDVSAIGAPDLAAVDLVARVHLVARRLGAHAAVTRASPELVRLVAFAGLAGIVSLEPSAIEPRGQPEHREHPRGVEEERDPGDRAV